MENTESNTHCRQDVYAKDRAKLNSQVIHGGKNVIL